MEPIYSVVRSHLHLEADAGYQLLRRVPSTRATAFFDYLDTISLQERDEYMDANARVFALGFAPTPANIQRMRELLDSDPPLVKFRAAMSRGPIAMGLRYQGIRMAQAILRDPQSIEMMHRTRSKLSYVPRDDAPLTIVHDADVTKLNPAKSPQLKKLIKPLMQDFLATKEDKMPGGILKYDGAMDGTPVKVRVDYPGRGMQLIYTVSIPDADHKVAVVGTTYEHYFGIVGGWDYITEENAETSAGLLPELIRRLVALRNAVKRAV